VEDVLGLAGAVGHRNEQQQGADQEGREDVAHAVKAETLAAFVGNDVWNLSGHRPVTVTAHYVFSLCLCSLTTIFVF
jgi:hypothetical protein